MLKTPTLGLLCTIKGPAEGCPAVLTLELKIQMEVHCGRSATQHPPQTEPWLHVGSALDRMLMGSHVMSKWRQQAYETMLKCMLSTRNSSRRWIFASKVLRSANARSCSEPKTWVKSWLEHVKDTHRGSNKDCKEATSTGSGLLEPQPQMDSKHTPMTSFHNPLWKWL